MTKLLQNRIVVSLVILFVATYYWEFYIKPVSGPLYTAAVSEYKKQNYERSLDLLQKAYRIDPNDAAILTLMGWSYLKLGDAESAEPQFERARRLAPHIVDLQLGYAYTLVEVGKYEQAAELLTDLRKKGVDTGDVRMALGTLYRKTGRNRDAAEEFQMALSLDSDQKVAAKNLEEIYGLTGGVRPVQLEPARRERTLTYTARVEGERFAVLVEGKWRQTYLAGVNLTPALPGRFPADPGADAALYADWIRKIAGLGANTIRVPTILSPAFYRALAEFNRASPARPLWLMQGIALGDPGSNDLFNREFYEASRKEIRDTLDVLHGQGDVAATKAHVGGIFNTSVAPWVAGLLLGHSWLSHIVEENNRLHPDLRDYQGRYIEIAGGNAAEVFLAQMLNEVGVYEEGKYNWQHPVGFQNWPALDPLRHPTESTFLEEVAIRRKQGERIEAPPGPYDDDDAVSLDPIRLRRTQALPAGYFAAYSVFPFYPDFLNHDTSYLSVRDAEGSNPFLGYLRDLKARHRGIPLLISDYGIPTSLGVSHFSPAGFNEGGKTEEQQGQMLARLTRNIFDAGAAGGLVFEWMDQWFRSSWLVRDYETPPDRAVFWKNFMDPAEHFGLLAVDPVPRHREKDVPPHYEKTETAPFQKLDDPFDPARHLKALYVDADEGFLYLRLVVARLDNDRDGRPDWGQVNYLIGLATAPGHAGLTYLPFITPIPFQMGMTYAIHLTGPDTSRIWVASTYNPFRVNPVDGIPAQTVLSPKLGWKAGLAESGSFEAQIVEPNRRRFGRDGRYFLPQRYDRGILRYGSLDPKAQDYDTLAEWHASVETNTIDIRIPWQLLNVTDPSSHKVFAGLQKDGTVETRETSGFVPVAFSYRPSDAARQRPIMDQGHAIADALPGMEGPAGVRRKGLKEYRWPKWDAPQYNFRIKDSYSILRKAWETLPALPGPGGTQQTAQGDKSPARPAGGRGPEEVRKKGSP